MNNPQNEIKLLNEDYENIWLRIKERIWKLVFTIVISIITVASTAVGIAVYQYSSHVVKSKVIEYVESKEFQEKIDLSIQPAIQNSIEKLNESTNQIIAMQKIAKGLQTTINGNTIILNNSQGAISQIEYGVSQTNRVEFKFPFQTPPVVIITAATCDEIMQKHQNCQMTIKSTDNLGFSINYTREPFPVTYNWIAIKNRMENNNLK